MSMGRYENLHVGMSGSIVLNQCCQYNLIRRDMIPAKPAPHETTGRRATTLHSAELGSINCNSNSNNSESMGRQREPVRVVATLRRQICQRMSEFVQKRTSAYK